VTGRRRGGRVGRMRFPRLRPAGCQRCSTGLRRAGSPGGRRGRRRCGGRRCRCGARSHRRRALAQRA
jgi:hypothetical protein